MHYIVIILDNGNSRWKSISVAQFQVDYQTEEWYNTYVSEYRSDNLIIFTLHILGVVGYCKELSFRLHRLMRNVKSESLVLKLIVARVEALFILVV